jgi:hypothetical protein
MHYLGVCRVGQVADRFEHPSLWVGVQKLRHDMEANASGDIGGQAEGDRLPVLKDQAKIPEARTEVQSVGERFHLKIQRVALLIDQDQVAYKGRPLQIGLQTRLDRRQSLGQLDIQAAPAGSWNTRSREPRSLNGTSVSVDMVAQQIQAQWKKGIFHNY